MVGSEKYIVLAAVDGNITQTDRSVVSSLRKQGSSDVTGEWIPAPRSGSRTSFAGMTSLSPRRRGLSYIAIR